MSHHPSFAETQVCVCPVAIAAQQQPGTHELHKQDCSDGKNLLEPCETGAGVDREGKLQLLRALLETSAKPELEVLP